jgi:aspartyl-tRNA(Asn)/glutamyl-tRNA(Gln) amidotransferase subunit A
VAAAQSLVLTPAEPLNLGLENAVHELARRPTGARSLTEHCLERIGDLDEQLGCMVHLDVDGALLRAAELDALTAAGEPAAPLHGIPIVIKEIFSISGMPDSAGTRLPLQGKFEPEGTLVRRLREAGCVILGKSLSTEFAMGQFNSAKVMPLNPCDMTIGRVTGGSSSGSAAALAAGYCGFSVGTDTGGSVRCPAAFCGLVGFKPTAGAWPTDGIFPLVRSFDSPGFFARNIADAQYLFRVLDSDPPQQHGPFRIGVPSKFFTDDLDDIVAGAFSDAQRLLRKAGHELLELRLPSMQPVADFFATELPLELRATLGEDRVKAGAHLLEPITRARLQSVSGLMPDAAAQITLQQLASQVNERLDESSIDVWMTPTVPGVAPPQDEVRDLDALLEWQARASRNTRCVNALRMTAISLPLAADLPVGLQLIARGGRDAFLIAVAAQLAKPLRSG